MHELRISLPFSGLTGATVDGLRGGGKKVMEVKDNTCDDGNVESLYCTEKYYKVLYKVPLKFKVI